MKAILAPARNTRPATKEGARPTGLLFPRQVEALLGHLRKYEPWQLESVLDVPPERAFYFWRHYGAFDLGAPGTPALLSFYGQAYRNMRPAEFDEGELAFAGQHLRILSALYGMLRPLDGILDHRLGLKKDFSPGGKTLHEFWGDAIYKELFKDGDTVVNLTSLEYAKLVTPYMGPGDKMVTCRFLVDKPGGPRGTVSTVRAARGLMARYMVVHKITQPEALQGFDYDDYHFVPARSSETEYVFVKKPRVYGGG